MDVNRFRLNRNAASVATTTTATESNVNESMVIVNYRIAIKISFRFGLNVVNKKKSIYTSNIDIDYHASTHIQ